MEIFGLNLASETMQQGMWDYGLRFLAALLILAVGYLGARFTKSFATRLLQRAHFELILVSFLSNILYVLVLTFFLIASLNKLGVQTASLITVLGAAGLAIGLALKDSLSNFAAGVMIILFKHFKIGDVVQSGNITGTVVEMNIFTTTLNTPTNEKVMVPNAVLTTSPLVNLTGNATRRIDHIIGVSYDDNLAEVRAALLRVVEAEKRTLHDPEPFIGVDALADNSVNFAVRVWVRRQDYGEVRSALLENIKLEFDRVGISIPYPQQEVRMIAVTPDKDAAVNI